MTISRNTIDKIRAANGADSTTGTSTSFNDDGTVDTKGTAPYGFTLVGTINQIERVAERMDEYGIELPNGKTVDLPNAAMTANNSASPPNNPSGN